MLPLGPLGLQEQERPKLQNEENAPKLETASILWSEKNIRVYLCVGLQN
jgi:hypothetical protein